MKIPRLCLVLVLTVLAVLPACSPAGQINPASSTVSTTAPIPQVTSTLQPTAAPAPTFTAAPTLELSVQLSYEPALYRDEVNGFELDYPSDWQAGPDEIIGSRGSQALLLSPGTTAETITEGGTRISLVINVWDPKNDLDAFVAQRKLAWEASGFSTLSKADQLLTDGRKAIRCMVMSPEKAQVYYLFTTVGENYLQLTGEGNLSLVEEIAGTLRPIE